MEPLILACLVAVSRLAFRSHLLYDLDSINFALALQHFDPRLHQPHPPGYYLYVCLGQLFAILGHDANFAFILLSVAASCGIVILIYKLALSWFGLGPARFSGVIFLFSPLGWFHGTVALTYSVETFFSALIGYLSWQIANGKSALVAPAAIVLGISAGVRPSSLLFLGPIYLYSLRKSPSGRRWLGLFILCLTLAAWIVPMLHASGGASQYFDSLLSLWRLVPAKNTIFNSSPATSVARVFTILFIYLLGFGTASIAVVRATRHDAPARPEQTRFTLVWVAPALIFFSFIFLQFVNSGYLLLLAPPGCLWLGLWASDWYETTKLRPPLKFTLLALCAATNVFLFLDAPLYCSYRSVRQFEAQLTDLQQILPLIAAPQDTILVSFDSHFLGYRHAGYYLPAYETIQYPEVNLSSGTRVFAMHNRDTLLLDKLPSGPYSRFILFPLPNDDPAYSAFLATVKARLPSDRIRIVTSHGHYFVTGPISLLPLLFPTTGTPPPCVSSASLQPGRCKQP